MILEFALALSTHIGMAGDYNEVHPTVRLVDGPFTVGAYLNSEGGISPYASAELVPGPVHFELGVVGGYTGASILPFFRAGFETSEDTLLWVAPAYEYNPDGSINLGAVAGVEVKF